MSCPECFTGHVHDGIPKGQITKIHGLDTYVAEPGPDKHVKGIIIIISDAFGMQFVNNKILADNLSEKGDFKVYLPDFMNGNPAPAWVPTVFRNFMKTNGGIVNWVLKPVYLVQMMYGMASFKRNHVFEKSWPVVKDFFIAVRKDEGAHHSIGAAGYCWGGKHLVNLAFGEEIDGKKIIDVGFTGHPSYLEIPSEIEKIKIPVSFAIGDKDLVVKPPKAQLIREVVEAKPDAERGEVKVYYGAGHGFCVRADHVLENPKQQAAEAEDQAIDWFNKHFKALSS